MNAKKPLRMTKQRRIILEELSKVKTHPTADEVHRLVRRRIPNISLGTVYRNLDVLSESGFIRKLELGGVQRRFDGLTEDHYHVRCVKCGRVDDVPISPLPGVEQSARRLSGYRILSHSLEFVGLCPRCSEEAPEYSEEDGRSLRSASGSAS